MTPENLRAWQLQLLIMAAAYLDLPSLCTSAPSARQPVAFVGFLVLILNISRYSDQ